MNYDHPDVALQRQLNEMAKKAREALPKSAFVFPDRRGWPIHDEEHARIALKYIKAERGDAADWPIVLKAVLKKYPDLYGYAGELGLLKKEEREQIRRGVSRKMHEEHKQGIRESLRSRLFESQAEVRHGSAMVGFRYHGHRITPTILARISSQWAYDREKKKAEPEFEMTLSAAGEQQEWITAPEFEACASKLLLRGAKDEGRPAQLEWQEARAPGVYTGLAEVGSWRSYQHGKTHDFVVVRADTDEIAEAVLKGLAKATGLKEDSAPERLGAGLYVRKLPSYEMGYKSR